MIHDHIAGRCAALTIAGLLACVPALAQESDHPAQALVRAKTRTVLSAIEADPEIREKRATLRALVERELAAHFDLQSMSARVLGTAWRAAPADLRRAFAAEFRAMLLRTYATAFAQYSGQGVRYASTRVVADQRVTVRTAIDGGRAEPLEVYYSMHEADGAWLVDDVRIAGVSLVLNYRSSFRAEIGRNGLEALIERMREKNHQSVGPVESNVVQR